MPLDKYNYRQTKALHSQAQKAATRDTVAKIRTKGINANGT